MAKEDTKVHLVLALNQDTFARLGTYITMRGVDKMAHLETVQDRLHQIPYVQMLPYLKQGKLSVLQEGFGLSSSPVLRGRGTGRDVIPFEAGLRMRFVPKQAVRRGPSM